MRNEFDIYLKDSFGATDQDILADALELFEQYSLPNYQDQYLALILSGVQLDAQSAADNFKLTIFNDLVMLVGFHGIDVNSHATHESLVEILRGLQVLENYEDAAAILQYLDSDGTNVDVLCDLLSLVSAQHDTYYLNIVASVKPALLSRLREMYKVGANASRTESDAPEVTANIVRLRKLYEYDVFKIRKGYEVIQAGVPLGMEFLQYHELMKTCIEDKDAYDTALELVVFLAMSSDGIQNPILTYKTVSEQLFDDLSKITEVDIQLHKVLGLIEQAAMEEKNEENFQ
jgi:DNA-binding ferritin-like protein (Dps family)